MKVSVVLCTYNGEEFLQEQLNSYTKQTILPDELIVCDDGSTDQTLSILQTFQTKAPFPVHISQNETQLGSSKNFLQAIAKASHEIILLSDQDDIWLPNKVDEFKRCFEKDSYLHLVFSNASLIDDTGKIIVPDYLSLHKLIDKWDNRYGDLQKLIIKNRSFVNGCLMGISNKLAKKITAFFEAYPDYEPQTGHDSFITMIASMVDPKSVREIMFVLMYYRQHDNQQIGVNQSNDRNLGQIKDDKAAFFSYKTKWLKSYADLLTLFKKDPDLLDKINAAIAFNEERATLLSKGKLSKIGFSLSNFLGRKYHRYTQYSLKEALRDIL